MRFLRQNTATRVTVGPFLDKTDGITPETALTVTNEKLTLVVDDGGVPTLVIDAAPTASGGNNDMVHISGDDAGFYDLELTATQTNYVGRAMLALTDAANHCPVFHEFMILPANVYDSLMGADNLNVNASKIGGTTQTGRDIGASVLVSVGTGTGQINVSGGKVPATVDAADVSGNPNVTANAVSTTVRDAIADSVWDEARSGHTTSGTFGQGVASVQGNVTGSVASVTGAVGSVTGSVGSVTAGVTLAADQDVRNVTGSITDKTGYALSSAGVQAVWDALTSALTTVGSIGKRLADFITGDAFARLGAPTGASVSADIAVLNSYTSAIKSKTDNLPMDPAATSDVPTAGAVADAVWDESIVGHGTSLSTGAILAAAGSAGDPWTTPLPGAYGPGTAGALMAEVAEKAALIPDAGLPSADHFTAERAAKLDDIGGAVASVTAPVTVDSASVQALKSTLVGMVGLAWTRKG